MRAKSPGVSETCDGSPRVVLAQACPTVAYLVVILGSLFPRGPCRGVVLDPELRVGLLHEILDRRAALGGLLLVEVKARNSFQRELLRVVIQIAREQHWSGLGEL